MVNSPESVLAYASDMRVSFVLQAGNDHCSWLRSCKTSRSRQIKGICDRLKYPAVAEAIRSFSLNSVIRLLSELGMAALPQ
jgi:hypothetical protein